MVVSREEKKGKLLAESTKSHWSGELKIPGSTDIIFVAVPDHSLEQVLGSLKCDSRAIVVHTAGSYGLDIFPSRIIRKGIFYPFQTFSQGRSIDLSEVPFLLESDNDETANTLLEIASSLSKNVQFTDAERRRRLHLAAVFICNFTNHMFTAGNEIVKDAGFNPDIMEPLIKETIAKALTAGPGNSQTGPASRNDLNTIEKHLEMLSANPWMHDLYKAVTQSIINYYKQIK